jgi:hypothetical protein
LLAASVPEPVEGTIQQSFDSRKSRSESISDLVLGPVLISHDCCPVTETVFRLAVLVPEPTGTEIETV